MAGSGHMTKKGWNVPVERPEANSEFPRNENVRYNSKREQVLGHHNIDQPDYNAYDRALLGHYRRRASHDILFAVNVDMKLWFGSDYRMVICQKTDIQTESYIKSVPF